ncbi:hypothetical protein P775_22655 [Puniceibacterium antarcticum]|uniref:Uncharacterized protein n=1 Tax=Puniceibacterium antarcticum TaxID=1206336 RepID=A0A2G8R9R3_9RHOB|nr:hypothetical protein P775_22655 [Puniceibacterium antarcticum]
MSEHYIPPLRRRFLEDMRIKGLQSKTDFVDCYLSEARFLVSS